MGIGNATVIYGTFVTTRGISRLRGGQGQRSRLPLLTAESTEEVFDL
jgi:hypothetical protein